MSYPFIVIEGLDGTGKTTLRKGLFRLWEGLYGVTPLCLLTTNFLAAEAAADIVAGKYQPSSENRDSYLAALATDKRATLQHLVMPQQAARPVIADRWLLSELAFFAVKHDMRPAKTYQHLSAALGHAPDLTLVLDLNPAESVRRSHARQGDAVRADWDVRAVQDRVRDVYDAVTAEPGSFPLLGEVVRLDSARPRADVLLSAWDALQERGLTPVLPTKESHHA